MKLKPYRTLLKLTLEEVAAALEVTAGTVSRWENGAIPKPAEMAKIRAWSKGAVQPNDFYPDGVTA